MQIFTNSAGVVLRVKLADSDVRGVMRPCLLRTRVYADPFLDVGKLHYQVFDRRVVGEKNDFLRSAASLTLPINFYLKRKLSQPSCVGGFSPPRPRPRDVILDLL